MDKHARILFTAAAAFNFIAGTAFLVAMPQLAKLIGMYPLPSDPLFAHFGAVLAISFGWGYWLIARDPVVNRPIIQVGIVGKSLVVLSVFFDWMSGNTNWPFALLVSGDVVFALLFLDYLRRRPRWVA